MGSGAAGAKEPNSGLSLPQHIRACPDGGTLEKTEKHGATRKRCRARGVLHGPTTAWFHDGSKSHQGVYLRGQKYGKWLTWYDNGALQVEAHFKEGRNHGAYHEYYEDGTVLKEATYLDGELHGEVLTYWPNGELQSSRNFQNGIEAGTHKSFRKDGTRYFEKEVRNGLVHGIVTFFDRDEIAIDQYSMEHGSGIWREYSPEGVTSLEEERRRGKPSGHYTLFHPNGKTAVKGSYHAQLGFRIGTWTEWDSKGQVASVFKFNSENGNSISETFYEEGSVSKEVLFFESGHRRSELEMRKGRKHGSATFYFDSVWSTSSSGSYENGKKHGPWRVWEQGSESFRIDTYTNGRKVKTASPSAT